VETNQLLVYVRGGAVFSAAGAGEGDSVAAGGAGVDSEGEGKGGDPGVWEQ